MSSPATSCSRRYTDNASTYCSRKRLITIASRNDFSCRFSVYQLGRGSEPVIVVGITRPAVAFNMWESPRSVAPDWARLKILSPESEIRNQSDGPGRLRDSYFQPVGFRVNRAGRAGLVSGTGSGSPDA